MHVIFIVLAVFFIFLYVIYTIKYMMSGTDTSERLKAGKPMLFSLFGFTISAIVALLIMDALTGISP